MDRIEAKNKLIAEFMGYKVDKKGFHKSGSYVDGDGAKHYTGLTIKTVKYHESWDWLMPVCYKLKTLETPESVDNDQNNNAMMSAWEAVAYSVACINLQLVYPAVVANIQLYNKIMEEA